MNMHELRLAQPPRPPPARPPCTPNPHHFYHAPTPRTHLNHALPQFAPPFDMTSTQPSPTTSSTLLRLAQGSSVAPPPHIKCGAPEDEFCSSLVHTHRQGSTTALARPLGAQAHPSTAAVTEQWQRAQAGQLQLYHPGATQAGELLFCNYVPPYDLPPPQPAPSQPAPRDSPQMQLQRMQNVAMQQAQRSVAQAQAHIQALTLEQAHQRNALAQAQVQSLARLQSPTLASDAALQLGSSSACSHFSRESCSTMRNLSSVGSIFPAGSIGYQQAPCGGERSVAHTSWPYRDGGRAGYRDRKTNPQLGPRRPNDFQSCETSRGEHDSFSSASSASSGSGVGRRGRAHRERNQDVRTDPILVRIARCSFTAGSLLP